MKKFVITTFVLLSLLLTMVTPMAFALTDSESAYSDISGKWFSDAATKYGYSEIFEDGNHLFSPNREITRIQFVRLLHKALGININYFVAPDIRDNFSDMTNADTGANELIDLVTVGIVDSNGKFDPDSSIQREIMVHWIMHALKYETGGNYAIPKVKPVPFNDDIDISDTYRGEIYSSVVLKLVKGRGNHTLFPKDGATRAEAVTIVSNLMVLLDSYHSTVQVSASASFVEDGSLAMILTIRNNTDKVVDINHTSGQKFDFKLFDSEGNTLYTWSADKMFIELVNKTELKPGEEITFSDTLDSATYNAIKQAASMKAYIVGTSDGFEIDPNGYDATIVK